jgi:hypothetical protein
MDKILETRILKYKYDSEEERNQHVKWMESQGFECSGKVRNTDDSIWEKNPNYYWYGEFIKHYK